MRKDWIECSLIEGCDIHDNLRKPINSKDRNERINGKDDDQLYPYYGATGQVGYIDDYLTEGEYVLIGEDAAPFLDYSKDVAYPISGKTWVNNHAHILKSKFNDKFLLHYLNHFNYRDYVSGTTRLKLTQGKLKQIPIRVAPLPEQRAIVAKIEELFSDLDKGVADFKKAQDQLKIYRQAVLKKAFEGELTKDWRELNNIEKNWEIVKLKDRSERVSVGHVGPTSEHYCRKEEGIPFLRSQNVRKGLVDFKGLNYITKEFHLKLKKSQLKPGDLLIVRVGANRGDAAVLPDYGYEINCANIVFARVIGVDPKYLNYYFNSPFWFSLIEALTTGSAQGVINTKIVAEVKLPLPTSEEQHQIVQEIESRISVCDNVEESISESLDKAEALRQSILKKAFEGNLLSTQEIEKCKTEPDYEPAAVLLEKIKNL